MTQTKLSEIGKGLSSDELLLAYQSAEIEISNLRRHLLWVAERLATQHRQELASRLNKNLLEGGTSIDPSEDKALEDREFLNTVDSIFTSYDRVIATQQMPHNALHMKGLIKTAKGTITKLRKPSLAYHRISR